MPGSAGRLLVGLMRRPPRALGTRALAAQFRFSPPELIRPDRR